SKWSTNEFILGGYSSHEVSCKCQSSQDLNVPVCAIADIGKEVPVLVLAGEANSLSCYSTVHGAFQNGISQVSHYLKSSERLKRSTGSSSIRSKI
ncbi:hypothetical protein SK128_022789, partial [Halocaridina rubra]